MRNNLVTYVWIALQAGEIARSGKCAFFALDVELKDGKDLAARDKTGTNIVYAYISSFQRENYTPLWQLLEESSQQQSAET